LEKGKIGGKTIVCVTFELSNHLVVFSLEEKGLKTIETLTFNDNILNAIILDQKLFVLTVDSPHLSVFEFDESNLKISEHKSEFIEEIKSKTSFKVEETNLTTFGILKRKLDSKGTKTKRDFTDTMFLNQSNSATEKKSKK
jgi:hypothetical protein